MLLIRRIFTLFDIVGFAEKTAGGMADVKNIYYIPVYRKEYPIDS
jgi:hypothetical protein